MRFLRDQHRREFVAGALGRRLKGWEEIHHIDLNHSNDDLTNLTILSRSEHRQVHQKKWCGEFYYPRRCLITVVDEIMQIVAIDISE